jgi:hypothetical protein
MRSTMVAPDPSAFITVREAAVCGWNGGDSER